MLIDHIAECKSRWHNGGKDCICDELRAYEGRRIQEGWIERSSGCPVCYERVERRVAKAWITGFNEGVDGCIERLDEEMVERGLGVYMRAVYMELLSRLKE